VEVINKDVLTVGGLQRQFIGVKLGKFLLVPDSYSGLRPEVLRVENKNGNKLLLRGGSALRVEIFPYGTNREGFLKYVTLPQIEILQKLSFNLPGRCFPASGEFLREHWEAMMGEEEILESLRNLFRGVNMVMGWVGFLDRIPFVGKWLADKLYPSQY
jgi:hypothetical protein